MFDEDQKQSSMLSCDSSYLTMRLICQLLVKEICTGIADLLGMPLDMSTNSNKNKISNTGHIIFITLYSPLKNCDSIIPWKIGLQSLDSLHYYMDYDTFLSPHI